MKVYLAGPRTGHFDYNRAAFIAAATDLRSRGIEVVSPVELDGAEEGMVEGGDGATLSESVYLRGLARCVVSLLDESVEAVVVLDGWEESRGAGVEVRAAQDFMKPILRYPDLSHARPLGSERFHAVLAEIATLHDRKQEDYGRAGDPFANVRGSTEWGVPDWVGAMIRATDKVRRLQTYARRGTLANEGVLDSFADLAVYAIIGRILFEDSRPAEPSS